jgi:hypothetical protein
MKMESKIIRSTVNPDFSRREEEEIFSSLGRNKDPSRPMTMIAFSSISDFPIRLSSENDNETTLNLIVHIRDTLDCVTSMNLSSVTVTTDLNSLNDFINTMEKSTSSNTNPSIQLLASGNQNIVGQLITSFSQQFNRMHSQQLDKARSSEAIVRSSFTHSQDRCSF